MKTIEIMKTGSTWYVIIKKDGVNISLASFATKKAALSCVETRIAQFPELKRI